MCVCVCGHTHLYLIGWLKRSVFGSKKKNPTLHFDSSLGFLVSLVTELLNV